MCVHRERERVLCGAYRTSKMSHAMKKFRIWKYLYVYFWGCIKSRHFKVATSIQPRHSVGNASRGAVKVIIFTLSLSYNFQFFEKANIYVCIKAINLSSFVAYAARRLKFHEFSGVISRVDDDDWNHGYGVRKVIVIAFSEFIIWQFINNNFVYFCGDGNFTAAPH